jgi:agmatinase
MTTFMGVPTTAEAVGGLTVLGVPFDHGSDRDRAGLHAAPAAIRASSTQLPRVRIDSDRDPLHELAVRDGGDIQVSSGESARSTAAITAATTEAVAGVLARGRVPLLLGGDGAVALAMLRALAPVVGPVAVIHLDAHTDCNPPGEGISEGSAAFWSAHAEDLVDTTASVHVGLRGPGLIANSVRLCGELGYRTIGMDAIVDAGVAATLAQIREIVGERPVYLCWDLDVFDPSVAPGVLSPSWGGIDTATGFRLLRGLADLHIVAADVNNMNLPADIAGMTASLAAQLAFEMLFAMNPPAGPVDRPEY